MTYPILDRVNNPADLKKLKIKELETLSKDIRKYMIEVVANTGGHLASSLGAVELTIALHYAFDSPKDKIIWDVGHQSYPHKILTGRKKDFKTLRKKGGISGFPKSSESHHDQFDVGHASTSLSIGLGYAKGRDILKEKNHVISIIGDGAMTGGIAFEGLNQIGYLQSKMIIILNDNKMSISNNVGALSKYTSRISKTRIYRKIKNQINQLIKSGHDQEGLKKLKEDLKHAANPNFLFEKLGIEYIGPVDGHNINEILKAVKDAKNRKGPVLLHLKTKKGKGFQYAEEDSTTFHGIGCFDRTNGKQKKSSGKSYSKIFGETLCKMASKNKKIVAISAAMCEGTGLKEFAQKFPNRFFDVGIAEQHAVTFAATLAKKGLIPVVAIYSTFLQRAYDQLVHDIALQNLPVIFAIDRAGLVGEDGPTHPGAFDISYLRHIPNMMLTAPKDGDELAHILESAPKYKCPIAIRFPRGCAKYGKTKKTVITPGSSELLIPGRDMVIVAVGAMVEPSVNAALKYNQGKNKVGVINARFVKPIDSKIIRYMCSIGKALVIEDNSYRGGFGSLILEELNKNNKQCKVEIIGLPDHFIEHGTRDELLDELGMSEEKIYRKILKLLSHK